MKFWEIFRFEFAYQLHRPWPWFAMAVLMAFAVGATRVGFIPVTLSRDFILNSPFIITTVTVLSCQIWLLVAPAVAGEAAARDVHTGIYPIMYTNPVSRTAYLGGRFLAALSLNALILLGVQAGSLLAVYVAGVDPEVIGPFRPAAYLAAYGLIALPNALIATAIQFSAALRTGRPMAAYVGSLGLFFLSYPVTFFLLVSRTARPEIALLSDPIGVFAIMNEMMTNWTIVEKNVRMFSLEGHMVWNRLLWVGIALCTLAFTYLRFRFAHRAANDLLNRLLRRFTGTAPTPDTPAPASVATSVPQVRRSFGPATHLRQTLTVARSSFWRIAKSPAGLFLLAAFPMMLVLVLLVEMQHWRVPLLPRTVEIISRYLTPPITPSIVTDPLDYWVMVPLLTIFLAAELVWRERDARLHENVDATPVPEWVLVFGKFLGLCLVLAALMAMLTVAGIVAQALLGYYEFEITQYLLLLFGFQLPQYLLFAMLAFAIQVVVNHKYLGQMVALVAYLLMVFPGVLGIHHNLLVYAASPAWSFTDMRGFGGSIVPWLWFKLYWAAWALLLAVSARLLWVRGMVSGFRLHVARRRFNPTTAGIAAMTVTLILTLGGFIFYNTNVLNDYITEDEAVQRGADYERRYGKYEGIPQPQRTATKLHIEIYPDRRAATIRGSYRLVNLDEAPIDSVHLEPARAQVKFDRPARRVVADDGLGHHIYVLDEPLQPGDSLTLSFEVRIERRGFRNGGLRSNGAGHAILENGTFFTGDALPIIGYQPRRELTSAKDRREQGLPRQVTLPPPGDIDPRAAAGPAATFDAVIGTDADQVAVAPGELRRTWAQAGRRYFHYASNVPTSGGHAFASADYAVHRERWNDVDIQVFLHPGHAEHVERLLRSVRASLDYYSAQFGPYPFPFLQVIEQPGNFFGMGVEGSGVIAAGEGIFLLDPRGYGLDGIFEIVAHEVGHQWWAMQLKPAFAAGGGVISEGLATFSAMQLVKHVKGREVLRQYMSFMREPNPWPPIRTGLPLLRAMDPWANYRKGPYAMNALAEYVGEERIHMALRTLIVKEASSLATTLDLYRELQAVTPDSLKPLLHDLFEVNTFWRFDTHQARAVQTDSSAWRVTFEVEARKVVTDSAGVQTEVPITERVEIGVFATAGPGEILGRTLYLQKHRIRSGTQTITVTVPDRPARGGIDPYSLLDWEEGENIERIEIEGAG